MIDKVTPGKGSIEDHEDSDIVLDIFVDMDGI